MAKLILILFLCLNTICAFAQETITEKFSQANEFYRQGDFPQAIETYHEILLSGYESGELYYNLGNAHFKSGELGKAILYFEKARRFLPRDQDLAANLKMAQMRVADRIEVPKLAIWKLLDKIICLWTMPTISIITLTLYLITLTLAVLYYFLPKGGWKKAAFYFMTPCLFIFLLSAAVFGVINWQEANIHQAIILLDKVEVVSAPDENAQGLFSLHEGVKIRITQQLTPWSEIQLPDGKKGWVKTETFAEI